MDEFLTSTADTNSEVKLEVTVAAEADTDIKSLNDGMHCCSICGRYCQDEKKLDLHTLVRHRKNQTDFACDLCGEFLFRHYTLDFDQDPGGLVAGSVIQAIGMVIFEDVLMTDAVAGDTLLACSVHTNPQFGSIWQPMRAAI